MTESHAGEQGSYDGDLVADDEAGEQVSYDEAGEQQDDEPVPTEPDDRAVPEPLPSDGADPRVAAAVARLDELGDTPPVEHVEVYEDVHRVLQDALADAARPPEPAGHEPAEQGRAGGPQQ